MTQSSTGPTTGGDVADGCLFMLLTIVLSPLLLLNSAAAVWVAYHLTLPHLPDGAPMLGLEAFVGIRVVYHMMTSRTRKKQTTDIATSAREEFVAAVLRGVSMWFAVAVVAGLFWALA